MMFLYVNGITASADSQAAVSLGAGAIGIAIGYGQNCVEPEKAREIFLSLPLFIAKVGVFNKVPRYEIEELITFCKLDALHFQQLPPDAQEYNTPILLDVAAGKTACLPSSLAGYVLEDPQDRQALKEISPEKIWLKGFSAWKKWQQNTEKMPYGLVLLKEELAQLIQTGRTQQKKW